MLFKRIPLSYDAVPTMSINSFQFIGRSKTFQSDEFLPGSSIVLHEYLKRYFVRKLQVTDENAASIVFVITTISSCDRLEFRCLGKNQVKSTYDACMSRASNEIRYNCYVAVEMDSTEASSSTYYGRVRAFLEVDIAHCEEQLDIGNVNWRNLYILCLFDWEKQLQRGAEDQICS